MRSKAAAGSHSRDKHITGSIVFTCNKPKEVGTTKHKYTRKAIVFEE